MPIDPGTAAAIGSGAAQVTGNLAGAVLTGMQNRASRKWSEEMYQRQYDDNLRLWHMQNEYNSPANQMQRFEAAGLNKSLIYGQGNGGNAGAISSPDVQQPEFRVPDLDFGSAIGNALGLYMDYEIKQAQVDNLRAQNTSILEDAMLKHAQREYTLWRTKRSVFDLNRDSEMLDTYYDAQRENLRQMKMSTDIMLRRDEREAAQNASSLREAAERILSMRDQRATNYTERARIRAATKDVLASEKLKQLDIQMRQLGVSPSDPLWARVLARILNLDDFGNVNQGPENPTIRRFQFGNR